MAATKKTSTKELVINFETDRETKGTFRFAEQDVPEGKRAAVGTLYVTKEALGRIGNPSSLVVTITPA